MPGTENRSLKIENIVASGSIADSIDLAEISSRIENCMLNRKKFPGAVFRLEKPKVVCLVFSSGKIVLTGLREKEELDEAISRIASAMKDAGVRVLSRPVVAITNIVCSYDAGKVINLNKLVVTLNMENIEYEPEQFPGLVYRLKDPKIVALLFSSGKIILTGGKNLDEIRRGADLLEQTIEMVS
ncbi:MAG: TATA-box-binding protein [Methanolinea sp.]|nr:TATA-box-binding protein [Methanolinea sp.]